MEGSLRSGREIGPTLQRFRQTVPLDRYQRLLSGESPPTQPALPKRAENVPLALLVNHRAIGVQARNHLARHWRALLDRVGLQLDTNAGRIGNDQVAVPIVFRHP